MTDAIPPWPMLHQNSQHTAQGLYPGPLLYQQSWSISVDGEVSSGVAVDAHGNIYFGAQDSVFYCYTAQGTPQWTYKGTYPFFGGPPLVGSDGVIYAASDQVYAFSPDGQVRWTYARRDIGMVIITPLTLSNDGSAIYVVLQSSIGQQDRLVALKSSNGTVLWEMSFVTRSRSTPALASDGTVYVGSDDKKFYAISSVDGSIQWTYDAGGTITSAPAVDPQGTIYFSRRSDTPAENKLIALKPDGSLLWQYTGDGYIGSTASPAIGTDGTIYMGFYGLHAITPTGTKKWATSTKGNIGIYPGYIALSSDGNIYFGTQDGKLYAYDATGNMLWSGAGKDTAMPAISGNGRLYSSMGTSSVFAIQSTWKGGPVTLSLDRTLYWSNQLQSGVYLYYTIQQPLPPGPYVLTFAEPDQPPDLRYTLPFNPRSGSGAIYLGTNNPAIPWSTTPPRNSQYTWTISMGIISGDSFNNYASTTITIAPPPQIQTILYNGNMIHASWSASSVAGATGYALQVAATDGTYQTSITVNDPSVTSGNLPVALLDTTKTFLFTLCLLGPGNSRSCSSGVQLLTTLPEVTLVSYEQTAIKATWQPDTESGVATFQLKVVEEDGSNPLNVTINDPTATSGQIPLPGPLDPTRKYLFTLLAQKAGGVSVEAGKPAIPLLVVAPQHVELHYDYVAQCLVAEWQPVTLPYLTVTGYHLELFQDSTLLISQITDQTTYSFQQNLIDESVFQVRVQALGVAVAGPYSLPATAPYACTVSYTYDSLNRLQTVTLQSTNTYTYTVDNAGNIQTAVCEPSSMQNR